MKPLEVDRWLNVYRAMKTARQIDQCEQQITLRGEAFFHVSGGGHESLAALASHLKPDDWLHCHYRDKALLVARGLPLKAFFDNLYCKHDASGRGRRMSAFFSDRSLHILSMVTPTGNNVLQSAGVAHAVKHRANRPIVVCSVGDGTTQQGEFLEGVAEAGRSELPMLLVVEDNRYAISTPTRGRTFFSPADGSTPAEFHGVAIHHVDGRDPISADASFERIVAQIRTDRRPAIVVVEVERLASHTNADDQTLYRSADEIRSAAESGDPVRAMRESLIRHGVEPGELAKIDEAIQAEVAAAEEASAAGREPAPCYIAKRPLPVELTHPAREHRGQKVSSGLTMRDALRAVLRERLGSDDRVSLYGEDIEDPKGDVFGVTRGLSTEFPGRVVNSPLSESTIVGVAIGRSLAGERPVAFLQFADFMPQAFNQIAGELATMFWRTDGAWESPVIMLAACGGYRPGLGPYHSQTGEGTAAHLPGLDVFMPSTATDAAGLLNAAFESSRPTLVLYPKALLNDPSDMADPQVHDLIVPIGTARKVRVGRDITLVGWGNTVRLCEKAATALEQVGVEAEVIDLRSLSPWDERTVLASAEKTARLLVVHEDNHTCGFGGEVIATVAEKTRVPVAMRRVARPDTYVPCNFANHLAVLPSFRRVLETAAELLNLDVAWKQPEKTADGLATIEAIGSGPADETVIVSQWFIQPGDVVKRGDVVAALEATKSVFELTSPIAGEVVSLAAAEGDVVPVGAPLASVRTEKASGRPKPITQEPCGVPTLTRRKSETTFHLPVRYSEPRLFDVGISRVSSTLGSRQVTNDELIFGRSEHSAEDIVRRTGIESRFWVGGDETAVSLAANACWQALDQEQLIIDDLNLVICTTTSPTVVTPSMACRVLNELTGGKTDAMIQAYDINAACSGYLYALQAGFDYLQSTPSGRVLIVTAEVLSPLLNLDDFDTAILFGDAASATILYGEEHIDRAAAKLRRPELSAKGEDGSTLSVPLLHAGFIQMKGRKVFSEAVRTMIASLHRTCERHHVGVDDLSMVVPHQANQRILDAIQSRIPISVYSNIRHYGNTSSSSIPLCLTNVLPTLSNGEKIGLCAFGGGFTFGAGVLESLGDRKK